jgi:hypothetical protein
VKKGIPITTPFPEIVGVLLNNGWDHLGDFRQDPSHHRARYSHERRTDDCALRFVFPREDHYGLNMSHK